MTIEIFLTKFSLHTYLTNSTLRPICKHKLFDMTWQIENNPSASTIGAARPSHLRFFFTARLYPRPGFFSPTRHPKPEHFGSGKPDRFHRKPVETGQIPVQIQIVRRIWEPAGLTGIPAGLTGNRSNSIFFLFWFKFKCPQSILNKCLYNIF